MCAQSVLSLTRAHPGVRSHTYLDQLHERLIDEDEGDEEGEDLLGVARDEADQEAALEGHHQHHQQNEPKADPHATHEVLQAVPVAELQVSEGAGVRQRGPALCIRRGEAGPSHRVTAGPEQSYREEGFLEYEQRPGEANHKQGLGRQQGEKDALCRGGDEQLRHAHLVLGLLSCGWKSQQGQGWEITPMGS